jgi:hypothetical protein
VYERRSTSSTYGVAIASSLSRAAGRLAIARDAAIRGSRQSLVQMPQESPVPALWLVPHVELMSRGSRPVSRS